MSQRKLWAVTPKLEVRFQSPTGGADHAAFARDLQWAITTAMREKGLGKHDFTETVNGRTVLSFEGNSPGAMADAIEPALARFRERCPLVLLLRQGEFYRRHLGMRGEPFLECPASMIVSLVFGSHGRMRQWEIDAADKLQRQVDEALKKADAGWLDGDGFSGETFSIFCYGHEVDSMWRAVEALLDPFATRNLTVSLNPARVGFEPAFDDLSDYELRHWMRFEEFEQL